jgi:hypothetical protein
LSIFCLISWTSPNMFIDDLSNFIWLEVFIERDVRSYLKKLPLLLPNSKWKKSAECRKTSPTAVASGESEPGLLDGSLLNQTLAEQFRFRSFDRLPKNEIRLKFNSFQVPNEWKKGKKWKYLLIYSISSNSLPNHPSIMKSSLINIFIDHEHILL